MTEYMEQDCDQKKWIYRSMPRKEMQESGQMVEPLHEFPCMNSLAKFDLNKLS